MAKCDYCKKHMLKTASCVFSREIINGNTYVRLMMPLTGEGDGTRCHDCGMIVKPGNYHHPGCDNEQCPRCGGQAFCCDCDHEELLE